jgi:hypothetical protein
VPVATGIFVAAPFGVTDARVLVGELQGAISAHYFGYSPMPLVIYFFSALLMRHPLSFVLGIRARAATFARRTPAIVARTLLEAWGLWSLFAAGGAFIVVAATGTDAAALKWATEVALVTVLAGLPCLTVATTCGLVARQAWRFWVLTPLALVIFAVFALGLHGERIPPTFPGTIEVALTSGRESLRTRAMLGALAWPVMGWLAVAVLSVRSASSSSKNPVRNPAQPLTEMKQ